MMSPTTTNMASPFIESQDTHQTVQSNVSVAEIKNQLHEAHLRIESLMNENAELLYNFQQVKSSTCWRMTAPLRKIADSLSPDLKHTVREQLKKIYHFFNRFLKVSISAKTYQNWIKQNDTLTDEDRAAIQAHIASFTHHPLISIIVPVYNTPQSVLCETLDSVLAQLYPHWELCIADDASTAPHIPNLLEQYAKKDARIKWVQREKNGHIAAASNTALELATGGFVALLDHDDCLAEQALYEVAFEINQHPSVDLFYSDEDRINAKGVRSAPYFKSDWNPELFFQQNMINHLGVYRRSIINTIGGFRVGFEGSQDYDLALRFINTLTNPTEQIRHIPAILYHWRKYSENTSFSEKSLQRCSAAAKKALEDYFKMRGESVEILPNREVPSWNRLKRHISTPAPLVSLIVPTKNKVNLLRPCIESLLHKTDYPNLEIIIVDHESDDPHAIEYMQQVQSDPRIRVLHYTGEFNYSDINNKAVQQAKGSVIGLINNDIAAIHPDWLKEMVALALVPEYGAVGAKLLYPSNRIQHAGVLLGTAPTGVAGHVFRDKHPQDPCYFGWIILARNMSAVTAACLIVRKEIFEKVGGLNADALKVSYNDVDLCLKIGKAGYLNVWTPYATLYHHESASRASDLAPQNVARARSEVRYMLTTWDQTMFTQDPFYNPNLSLDSTHVELATTSRRIKPWQSFKK